MSFDSSIVLQEAPFGNLRRFSHELRNNSRGIRGKHVLATEAHGIQRFTLSLILRILGEARALKRDFHPEVKLINLPIQHGQEEEGLS